jgi:hypothetical protein
MLRATVMKSLVFVIAGVIVTLVAWPAHAGVTWTLYETSCTPTPLNECMVPPFPFEVGEFVLPNINSSGTYSFDNEDLGTNPIEMGDKDFLFEFSDRLAPATDGGIGGPSCKDVNTESITCHWNIDFSSSPTGFSFHIHYQLSAGPTDNIDIGGATDIGWSGNIGSDYIMLGCGEFSNCDVSGYVVLSSVSEPSSLVSMATGLIVIFLFAPRRRRADFG